MRSNSGSTQDHLVLSPLYSNSKIQRLTNIIADPLMQFGEPHD